MRANSGYEQGKAEHEKSESHLGLERCAKGEDKRVQAGDQVC